MAINTYVPYDWTSINTYNWTPNNPLQQGARGSDYNILTDPYTTRPEAFGYTEYAIRGQMVVAKMSVGPNEYDVVPPEIFKKELAVLIAGDLLKGNLISFTRFYDLATDTHNLAARTFVVSNEDVQLLRTVNNELPKR